MHSGRNSAGPGYSSAAARLSDSRGRKGDGRWSSPSSSNRKISRVTHRQHTGRQGEQLAVAHLRQAGYEILARNWRCGRAEIDIVARRDGILVFCEVKTRRSDFYGPPEQFFSSQQADRISRAASRYLEESGHDWAVRFDLIAVQLFADGTHQLRHLSDAFFPGLF